MNSQAITAAENRNYATSGSTTAITYGARGYPPSSVPEDPTLYSQDRATDDIGAVMDHLDINQAHIVACLWADLRRCISAFVLAAVPCR